MIRKIKTEDKNQLHELFSKLGLFDNDELSFMSELVDNILNNSLGDDHQFIVYDENLIKGAAYYAPENFADGVYNLYFIGVLPENQGSGVGRALLEYVENHIRQKGVRMLLIETSSKPSFEKTWRFYTKNGYEKEAIIRDYYRDGDDKILFRKKL
jgi:ribosomal protein S18 acetylase RimI-like enzyme